jgi:hypothetical protein
MNTQTETSLKSIGAGEERKNKPKESGVSAGRKIALCWDCGKMLCRGELIFLEIC